MSKRTATGRRLVVTTDRVPTPEEAQAMIASVVGLLARIWVAYTEEQAQGGKLAAQGEAEIATALSIGLQN